MRFSLPIFLAVIISFFTPYSKVQAQTVGLFLNTPQSFNGYTFFSGYMGDTIYLIDNCGKLVHKWSSKYRSSRNSVHLLPNGNVIYSGKLSSAFNSGSGLFEMQDWSGNLEWQYAVSDTTQCAHHGFTVMSNGNILAAVWEKKSIAEQIAAGRNPAYVTGPLWVDKIMEIKPVGTNAATIVWEWKLWDHLVQEFDATKANYAPVKNHPELVDVNLLPGTQGSWAHVNNVDYNPQLDQVMISCRNFDEFYVIDHTTTTGEAAGHTGGHSKKGGDLLYRWGNPVNYGAGSVSDRKLFRQHDAHWIPQGLPDAGKIMVFNNGDGRPAGKYSTVEILQPPLQSDSSYDLQPNSFYGPATSDWQYPSQPDTNFFSLTQGGAQQLPNGNVLIAESNTGDFQEVDATGVLVWRYVNPVNTTGINAQGDPRGDNAVFKIRRYEANYGAFAGKNLIPGAPLEINPYPYNCAIYPVSVDNIPSGNASLHIYPNPANDQLFVAYESESKEAVTVQLLDIAGRVVLNRVNKTSPGKNVMSIAVNHIVPGMYILKMNRNSRTLLQKLIIE